MAFFWLIFNRIPATIVFVFLQKKIDGEFEIDSPTSELTRSGNIVVRGLFFFVNSLQLTAQCKVLVAAPKMVSLSAFFGQVWALIWNHYKQDDSYFSRDASDFWNYEIHKYLASKSGQILLPKLNTVTYGHHDCGRTSHSQTNLIYFLRKLRIASRTNTVRGTNQSDNAVAANSKISNNRSNWNISRFVLSSSSQHCHSVKNFVANVQSD